MLPGDRPRGRGGEIATNVSTARASFVLHSRRTALGDLVQGPLKTPSQVSTALEPHRPPGQWFRVNGRFLAMAFCCESGDHAATDQHGSSRGPSNTESQLAPMARNREFSGCGSKKQYQNGTLVSGNMDQNLRILSCLILSHTQCWPGLQGPFLFPLHVHFGCSWCWLGFPSCASGRQTPAPPPPPAPPAPPPLPALPGHGAQLLGVCDEKAGICQMGTMAICHLRSIDVQWISSGLGITCQFFSGLPNTKYVLILP